MMSEVFTVFDRAVKAFLPPFFARNKGEAVRSFSDAVNSSDHQFHKHATDYSLWMIGSYDDANGHLVGVEPERVITALECLADDVLPPEKRVA